MAVSNSTETPTVPGVKLSGALASSVSQHEKISCSPALLGEAELLCLRGKRIRYATLFEARPELGHVLDDDAFAVSFLGSGKVVGVFIASPDFSDPSSLLILQDGYDEPDFFDLGQLTLLEVFSGSASAI